MAPIETHRSRRRTTHANVVCGREGRLRNKITTGCEYYHHEHNEVRGDDKVLAVVAGLRHFIITHTRAIIVILEGHSSGPRHRIVTTR